MSKRFAVFLCATTMSAFGAPALAQTTTTDVPASVSDDTADAVFPRSSSRRDAGRRMRSAVPAALSVVGGDLIDQSYTVNTQVLTTLIPTLNYSSANPRNTAFTIRVSGVERRLRRQSAKMWLEPGVGFYVDQVYHARPATAAFDFADIEQVEELRGPQGTLFGKNTTAGALNITTRAPTFTPRASPNCHMVTINFVRPGAGRRANHRHHRLSDLSVSSRRERRARQCPHRPRRQHDRHAGGARAIAVQARRHDPDARHRRLHQLPGLLLRQCICAPHSFAAPPTASSVGRTVWPRSSAIDQCRATKYPRGTARLPISTSRRTAACGCGRSMPGPPVFTTDGRHFHRIGLGDYRLHTDFCRLVFRWKLRHRLDRRTAIITGA